MTDEEVVKAVAERLTDRYVLRDDGPVICVVDTLGEFKDAPCYTRYAAMQWLEACNKFGQRVNMHQRK